MCDHRRSAPDSHTMETGQSNPAGMQRKQRSWILRPLTLAEDAIYLVVSVVLIAIAGALLYHSISDALNSNASFPVRVTDAVNGVLFVVIVLELFRTVIAHFEGGGFQLKPFLIIGVISAVRHILLSGTRSFVGETDKVFNHVQIEFAVNAGVALALVIALVLVERTPATADDGRPTEEQN